MVDNVKESLSALIDGEASEIEVHRLLRDTPLDGAYKATWARYHQVRTYARREPGITVERHLELHSRISQAISLETAHADGPVALPRAARMPYLKPAAGLALAASLVVAVFVGVNQGTPGTGSDLLAIDRPTVDMPGVESAARAPIDATFASSGAPAELASEPASQELDLKELDEDQLKAVRAYLNQHDRAVRMNPNMRTVIFEDSNGNGK